MNKSEQVEQSILQWIDQNREKLPISIDKWEFCFINNAGETSGQDDTPAKRLNGLYRIDSFYKPISRIIKTDVRQ